MRGFRHHCLIVAIALALLGAPHAAWADCTNPAAPESWTRYDFTAHTLYLCNGTNWLSMAGGGSSSGSAGYIQFSDGSGGFSNSGTTAGEQFFWDNTNKWLGLGTATPAARLHIAGDIASPAWALNGIALRQAAATYTDTTSSGVSGDVSIANFEGGAMAASSATTYANASTVTIIGAPSAGTNVTITRPFAFMVTGNTRFNSFNSFGNVVANPASVVFIGGNQSAASWSTTGLMFAVDNKTLTDTTGSGTIATRVATSFGRPTFASTNATTLTNAANVYISNSPVAGTNTTITNPLSLYVGAGASSFGDNVGIGTTAPGALLHAVGGQYNTGIRIESASTTGAGLHIKNTDTGGGNWYVVSTGSGNTGGAGNLGIYNGTSYPMYIQSGGNVGIGSTTPSSRLTVVAPDTATTQAELVSSRSAIVSTNVIGGLDFRSNDSNLTAPGTVVASIRALASATHTASELATDLTFSTTTGTAFAERMRIDKAGNVGIGTTTPSTKLEVNGDVKAVSYLYSSDRRLKTGIAPLPAQLDNIAALEPVSYVLKSDPERRTRLGLIAQDVEAVYPEVVTGRGEAMKAVDYAALVSPLIAAVKELKAANDNLRAANETLAARAEPATLGITPVPLSDRKFPKLGIYPSCYLYFGLTFAGFKGRLPAAFIIFPRSHTGALLGSYDRILLHALICLNPAHPGASTRVGPSAASPIRLVWFFSMARQGDGADGRTRGPGMGRVQAAPATPRCLQTPSIRRSASAAAPGRLKRARAFAGAGKHKKIAGGGRAGREPLTVWRAPSCGQAGLETPSQGALPEGESARPPDAQADRLSVRGEGEAQPSGASRSATGMG